MTVLGNLDLIGGIGISHPASASLNHNLQLIMHAHAFGKDVALRLFRHSLHIEAVSLEKNLFQKLTRFERGGFAAGNENGFISAAMASTSNFPNFRSKTQSDLEQSGKA